MSIKEEDRIRSRNHDLVRQTPAHMAITELVNACHHSGWLKGAGHDNSEQSREVQRRRDILDECIADIWWRLRQAEARIAEASQPQER